MLKLKQIVAAFILSTLVALSYSTPVRAAQATSPNYGVSEVNFSSGSLLQTCSASFCSKQTAGELTVGNTASTNYRAQAGFNTSREPLLEVDVAAGQIDLGILDETAVGYGSTNFAVRTYLASGYDVYVDGSPPQNKTVGHTLTAMTTADISRPGQEQFGINFRDNASPDIGANVQQIPSGVFSFGTVTAGYYTVDNFKYVSGQRIATSASSSGQTLYTMSVIANVGTTSPGGVYAGRLSLIIVPTF